MVPFGPDHIDVDLAAAAIVYATMLAWSAAYPGWRRGAWGLVTGNALSLTMTYPAWPRLLGRSPAVDLD